MQFIVSDIRDRGGYEKLTRFMHWECQCYFFVINQEKFIQS